MVRSVIWQWFVDLPHSLDNRDDARYQASDVTACHPRFPTSGLTEAEVRRTLQTAYQMWAQQTNLQFLEADSGPVDLEIRWEEAHHGDGEPFDDKG